MIKRIKRLKKIRLHREGTDTLLYGFIVLAAIALLLWRNLDNKIPFWFFVVVAVALYGVVVNFFRCLPDQIFSSGRHREHRCGTCRRPYRGHRGS